jgi:hypothetical protein
MGGVASAAWAEAVNRAYEAGIVYVAAAGNNISAGFFAFPTHQIVYPARFRRVIAACGVMADRRPYYGLKAGTMQGNWGPQGAMATALSAYTPNIAWARWGCEQIVLMDGAGTSAATPQIAAAAALYLQTHGGDLFDSNKYPEPWMRVEAVRRALFSSADKSTDNGQVEKLGNGILRAADALTVAPVDKSTLEMTPADDAGFPFLNILSRNALAPSATDRMLKLEATQLLQRWDSATAPNPLESAVADPDRLSSDVPDASKRTFLEAVRVHKHASDTLKKRVGEVLDSMTPSRTRRQRPPAATAEAVPAPAPMPEPISFKPPTPPYRQLWSYAVDPSLTTSVDTVGIGELVFQVPWEKLDPGPSGEYLEVVDVDPASEAWYEPVNLDDSLLLAQNGLRPSEGLPQFHQQMVYAVCSLTIRNFEHALGRKTLWRPKPIPGKPFDDSVFVPQLRVYPHALREANAYYSPAKIALLFGYYEAVDTEPGRFMPGGRVFTCLSHDIVAHETTHALLDGMHRRFLQPSNRDVLAFHEGFADCVAMLQHFTFSELVAHQIAATRGEIDSQENILMQLAVQFGNTTGLRTALRDAIGVEDPKTKTWTLRPPDVNEYQDTMEPHDRGRILVSAVFDAFLTIYKRRTADLVRLATGGTGVLRPGAIHPDLVQRMAQEAAKSAQHVLTMCIRALDYCPPTDITFGEYLRAIITADYDLVADDDLNYRVAFIEAFQRRGIYPRSLRTLSVESLRWRPTEDAMLSTELRDRFRQIRVAGTENLYDEVREAIFKRQRNLRGGLHGWLKSHFKKKAGAQDAKFLGIDPAIPFEVHIVRFAFRTNPDGGISPQLLVGLLQRQNLPIDPNDPSGPQMVFEGGSTFVLDLRELRIKYCIVKNLRGNQRQGRQREFALREFASPRATYLNERPLADGDHPFGSEPFALVHRGW